MDNTTSDVGLCFEKKILESGTSNIFFVLTPIFPTKSSTGFGPTLSISLEVTVLTDWAKAAFKVNPDVVVIAPDDLWFLYKDNEFNGYHSRIDFANLKRTKKVLFISNEIHRRFIELGVSLGEGTGVNKFNKEFLKDFSKVSQVKDKHYGGFGITKNNIITFYTNY